VRLSVDLVSGTYEEEFEEAVIMSGDDDFLYAVEVARRRKPVHMAFASRYGYSMAHNVNSALVIDWRDHFAKNILPMLSRPPQGLAVESLGPETLIRHCSR
jgi:hypothetical protein